MLSEHISLSNSCYPHAVLGWIDKQNKKEEGKVHYHINRYVALHFDCLGEAQISIDSQPQRKKLPFVIVRRSPNILDRRTWIIKNKKRKKEETKKLENKTTHVNPIAFIFRGEKETFDDDENANLKEKKKRAKRKGSRGSFKKGKKTRHRKSFFFYHRSRDVVFPSLFCVCVLVLMVAQKEGREAKNR